VFISDFIFSLVLCSSGDDSPSSNGDRNYECRKRYTKWNSVPKVQVDDTPNYPRGELGFGIKNKKTSCMEDYKEFNKVMKTNLSKVIIPSINLTGGIKGPLGDKPFLLRDFTTFYPRNFNLAGFTIYQLNFLKLQLKELDSFCTFITKGNTTQRQNYSKRQTGDLCILMHRDVFSAMFMKYKIFSRYNNHGYCRVCKDYHNLGKNMVKDSK